MSKVIEIGNDNGQFALDQICKIAYEEATIKLADNAMEKVKLCHNVVIQALKNRQSVYGLTVGVGRNKDRRVALPEEINDADLYELSEAHNNASLRAHAAGFGEPLPKSVVRAAIVVRINQLLKGGAGVQPALIKQLKSFLEMDITPVVPSKGSVGMADITQNAHIGLCLIGEWEVFYKGERIETAKAFEDAGLTPIHLVGKDFLSMISSNNLTAAHLALILHDIGLFMKKIEILFAQALEGINGNLSPFLSKVTGARPFPHMCQVADKLRHILAGSDLWKPSNDRLLQDPLSIRSMAYTLGDVYEYLELCRERLLLHINHSDDNPLVSCEKYDELCAVETLNQVKDSQGNILGAIYPSANYDGQSLAVAAEQMSASLTRLSNSMAMQLVRTELTDNTNLPRFLAYPGNSGHAFGALQKPMLALDRENQILAMPVSIGQASLAGGVEDVAAFGILASQNLEKILANLYEMASLHLLHFSQAIDLRSGFKQAESTEKLHNSYRVHVPLVTSDRVYTKDIEAGVHFLYQWQPYH